jgi:hypothetical protein
VDADIRVCIIALYKENGFLERYLQFLLKIYLGSATDRMLSSLQVQFIQIAPLLPASVALLYIISVVSKWEQTLARRMSAYKTRSNKDMKVSSPPGTNDIKPRRDSSFISHLISAASPTAHYCSTSLRLWNMARTETVSTSTCVIQIIIIVAEFVIDYVCYSDPQRSDLFALGASWSGMALRSQVLTLRSGYTGIASSVCITVLAVNSILPEQPMEYQDFSRDLALEADKSNRADLFAVKNTRPVTTVHIHICSVSLLLVYLVHDYPTVSSTLLYRFPWMGSSPHWLIAFGLLLLREGVDNWQRTTRQEQTLAQHVGTFVSQVYAGTPDFVRCVLMVLSVIGPWFLLFFVSNFLTSCLGFRALILGRPRTMPQFLDGGIFGGFIYLMVVSVQLLLRRNRYGKHKPGGTFHLLMTFGTAFGQTITGLVTVAVGLYGLQMFDNPNKNTRCG